MFDSINSLNSQGCCSVYNRVCLAEEFCLLLANCCDRIAALALFKKNPRDLSAYIIRAAVLYREVVVKLAQVGFRDNFWPTLVPASQ